MIKMLLVEAEIVLLKMLRYREVDTVKIISSGKS